MSILLQTFQVQECFPNAQIQIKRTMPECFVEVINKCLYLFRGAECRDNEADGKKWRGLAVPVLHVDNQVQDASLGTR